MKKHYVVFVAVAGWLAAGPGFVATAAAQADLGTHCSQTMINEGACPEDVCLMGCAGGEAECETLVCLPRPCPDFDAASCPSGFCEKMVNCSGETICHYPMVGGTPVCGGTAYAGQDVECCAGFSRRCGMQFFDESCDMQGKDSIYELPICLPCGNGNCNQFENACNCPEDCAEEPGMTYKGLNVEPLLEKLKAAAE